MTPILTITLNPALDLATATQGVRPGPKLRCEEPRVDPGGGGINVARAVRLLGGEARAFVVAGGVTGARLLDLLAREGTPALPFAVPGETRESLSVTDRLSGQQYRFVLPGPAWDAEMTGQLLTALDAAIEPGTLVVLSGSQPPGLHDAFPAALAGRVAGCGARLVVDVAGPPLTAFVAAPGPGAEVLRMNSDEAETLAGTPLSDRRASAGFAHALVARGVARAVILARGAEGSVMASREGLVHCSAPLVPVRSKVGAGDSFVAGFTLALARGCAAPEALRHGVAAASSAVMTEGTALCTREDSERLLPECVLTPLG